MEDKEFEKFLSKKTCRGCYNHCPLTSPSCGRSKIFIKDAREEYEEQKRNNIDNDNYSFTDNSFSNSGNK